jgi:phosphoribosylaminoimidazolecarboxamide formyltransferase/IMP cyclohydrolase
MTDRPVQRALLSVSDKTNLVAFAKELQDKGVQLISTGGTKKTLHEAGLKVIDVASVTGFPEIMDGRVKTLHPKVHGGLLAVRSNPDHEMAMDTHGIKGIDMLVVNLYPFQQTVASGADRNTIIENIDIGGPAMIRAAAKNHGDVTVLVDPDDYGAVLDAMDAHNNGVPEDMRQALAQKAFSRTAAYDAAISSWFADTIDEPAPAYRAFGGKLVKQMRYGENPHQKAAFYATGEQRPGVVTAIQIQGKQLSYNNINDTDAAYELVGEFDPDKSAAVAIIKHANPCGVAEGNTLLEAYEKALRCDPVSAFGGIVALNKTIDADVARKMTEIFTEVIIAPDATDEARAIIAAKKNLRLLLAGGLPDPRSEGMMVKSVAGGLLVQTRDSKTVDDLEFKVVTKRAPTEQEMQDLRFAFRVAKHIKSNTIVYAKGGATVGIGAGQMSRVDSARIAARKAMDAAEMMELDTSLAEGSVVASDAFFPFSDGLYAAINAGATAVVQPGGSKRDNEVIEAADEAGIAMVFTGVRHFRH